MNPKTLTRIDLLILIYAIILSGGAFVFFGMTAFIGVCVGSVIALTNWILSRWLGVRLILSGQKQKVAIFLGVKTAFILGIILLVLSFTSIEPLPFMIGLSALVLGVLSKGLAEAVVEGDKVLREER
jgi:hypothetical protein